ncbi:MAG TPA: organomercurial lyase [Candidatus Bathyarchaeia archaeon]
MSQSTNIENLQKNVRKYIFEHFEEHTTAPVLEQIMRKFGLDRASTFKALTDLQSARHIALLTGTQRILMAFPFSSIVTPFRVTVTGKEKEYFANCAWDAVAIHVALGKEQWISSYCHHCSEDIGIHLKDQRVISQHSNNQPLIYLALPASKWWENIVLTCSNNMVFFASRNHLAEWTKSNAEAGGEALTIDQTLQLSVPIYKTKMNIDYARPSRELTIAHFHSLGLTSDFWKI